MSFFCSNIGVEKQAGVANVANEWFYLLWPTDRSLSGGQSSADKCLFPARHLAYAKYTKTLNSVLCNTVNQRVGVNK